MHRRSRERGPARAARPQTFATATTARPLPPAQERPSLHQSVSVASSRSLPSAHSWPGEAREHGPGGRRRKVRPKQSGAAAGRLAGQGADLGSHCAGREGRTGEGWAPACGGLGRERRRAEVDECGEGDGKTVLAASGLYLRDVVQRGLRSGGGRAGAGPGGGEACARGRLPNLPELRVAVHRWTDLFLLDALTSRPT